MQANFSLQFEPRLAFRDSLHFAIPQPIVLANVTCWQTYSPVGQLKSLAPTRGESTPPTSSCHRLQRGLPGYLILFAPHAFASQRQSRPSELPSPLVFLLISAHFTATPGIPLAPSGL